MSDSAKIKILFVCMGNICRSPSAEGAFLKLIREHDVAECFEVDSAGTHGYHNGEPADSRSHYHAKKRDIDISGHRARQVKPDDFDHYDLILAMDNENITRLLRHAPPETHHKIRLFLEFAPQMPETEVPDPYYGGETGFERVLDLVEAASEGLLSHYRSVIS